MKGKLDVYVQNAENTICDIYYRGVEDGINICIDILRNFYEVGNEEQNKFMRMLENELIKKRNETYNT